MSRSTHSKSRINIENDQEINVLIEEKLRLASEGRYIEAGEIKDKIEKIKKTNYFANNQSLSGKHQSQDQELEYAFNVDLQVLSDKWNEKIQEFVNRGKAAEMELANDHTMKIQKWINDLTNNYPAIKLSKECLEGRIIEANLAKKEHYSEANYYKVRCDQLEKMEIEKYTKERNLKIQTKADNLVVKQQNEKKVLRERLDRQFDLWQTQKDKDVKTWITKYKNKKLDLDVIHRQEVYIYGNENKSRLKATSDKISSMIKTQSRIRITSEHSDNPTIDCQSHTSTTNNLHDKNKNCFREEERQEEGNRIKEKVKLEMPREAINNNENYGENDDNHRNDEESNRNK